MKQTRGRIAGKIVKKYTDEWMYLFEFENGDTHEAMINDETKELYPRIRKGTAIVLIYDHNDNFVSLGI